MIGAAVILIAAAFFFFAYQTSGKGHASGAYRVSAEYKPNDSLFFRWAYDTFTDIDPRVEIVIVGQYLPPEMTGGLDVGPIAMVSGVAIVDDADRRRFVKAFRQWPRRIARVCR